MVTGPQQLSTTLLSSTSSKCLHDTAHACLQRSYSSFKSSSPKVDLPEYVRAIFVKNICSAVLDSRNALGTSRQGWE
ncbi:hypothetical protein A0H81_11741 [Grifola frondosa]|uniref:Uncharacterized protein n=1 Tax=Grifola frondosa TaxID=5627 RepID=A0A1C7LTW4_GRIFR|nr:hypothetical protein A0H81_11741 [Grifola frondosa]